QVTKLRDDEEVRPREHYKKGPEGKGWVIEIQGYTYHHAKDNFIRDTLLTNLARRGIKAEVKVKDDKPAGASGAPATPAAPAAPATPAPPPATPAAPDPKKDEEATKEPVIDRISHVVLYNALPKPVTDTLSFELINSSALDGLISDGAGGPGAPGSMGPAGPG